MKILICGDSWSEGYGVKSTMTWPNFINHDFVNVARSGASNKEIVEQFLKNYNESYDAVIIGWSGVTRFRGYKRMNEFSSVDDMTIEFFKEKTLINILESWDDYMNIVMSNSKVPVIQYSVFGDKPLNHYPNFLEKGYLEYLANASGVFFKYDIPIFEFDWLNKRNYKLTKSFGKKFFNKSWQSACVEREAIRPSKYFLHCGHPNKLGHRIWANNIKELLDDIVF